MSLRGGRPVCMVLGRPVPHLLDSATQKPRCTQAAQGSELHSVIAVAGRSSYEGSGSRVLIVPPLDRSRACVS